MSAKDYAIIEGTACCTAAQSRIGGNTICSECYAEFSRITPLINPKACLKNHRQYICQTCGRYICAAVDNNGKYRAGFPFRTLEIAKLYLRSAEVITGRPCEIYEIENKNGRKSYKMFSGKLALEEYVKKNSGKRVSSEYPLFRTHAYKQCSERQLRKLTPDEAKKYLQERKEQARTWRNII